MRSILLIALFAGLLAAGDGQNPLTTSYAKEAAGDLSGAISAIEATQRSHPDDYLLTLRLGWLNYRLGAHQTANAYYQAACRLCPESIEARLGALLPPLAQRNWPELERQARSALHLDPGNPTANRWLAEAQLAQGRHREALDVARRLGERYPADATFTELLARSEAANRNAESSRATYEKLLRLDPTNATAKVALGVR